MSAMIKNLWRAVMKGGKGHLGRHLFIDTVVGVQDDRRLAVRRAPSDANVWAPKAAFHVCMNTPQMAVEEPRFDKNDESISQKLDPAYTQELAGRVGKPAGVEIQYADDTYSLHDTKGAFVSFLNLASVKALSEFMGVEIDPRRFRMNVWMTGLEPFEELTWVDGFPGSREIQVGECRMRVDDACERCKAVDADPATGTYHLAIQNALDQMMSAKKYKSPHRGTPRVMGILAQPLNDGLIKLGDTVQLV